MEAQATVAFVILNKIYGVNNSKTAKVVADAFHGGGTSAKQYERFLHGADVYKDM
jgi:hypothetical protein